MEAIKANASNLGEHNKKFVSPDTHLQTFSSFGRPDYIIHSKRQYANKTNSLLDFFIKHMKKRLKKCQYLLIPFVF